MKKYVIISPVRNEEEFIETTIQSVVSQTIQPSEYIIVNDGSTDATRSIAEKYEKQYDWIKIIDRPPKEHSPGAGVVNAFYDGYNTLTVSDWDFVIKLDGDLKFDENYFEAQIDHFDQNPKLGIASGRTYQIKRGKLRMDYIPEDHTRGPAKMYKRACWEDIGGLPSVLGWDTLDELKAQVLGWETKNFRELVLIHYKPVGYKQKNIVRRELKAGERHHYLGYLPAFVIMRGFYRMLQKPIIIAGILNLCGYTHACITRGSQIEDKEIISHLRKKQKQRLLFKRRLFN